MTSIVNQASNNRRPTTSPHYHITHYITTSHHHITTQLQYMYCTASCSQYTTPTPPSNHQKNQDSPSWLIRDFIYQHKGNIKPLQYSSNTVASFAGKGYFYSVYFPQNIFYYGRWHEEYSFFKSVFKFFSVMYIIMYDIRYVCMYSTLVLHMTFTIVCSLHIAHTCIQQHTIYLI